MLEQFGFTGNLEWIHNEEGSGAKFYNSSVYFPDSLSNPQTHSGVTIDPGVDLANASHKIINKVLTYYRQECYIDDKQHRTLKEAIGLTKQQAVWWIKQHRSLFKNKFLVPDDAALFVMGKYVAPDYWLPLIQRMPGLLGTIYEPLRGALHTALLSHSYNRGYAKTISMVDSFMEAGRYEEIAEAIKSVWHPLKGLRERRKAEAKLITDALHLKERFNITVRKENNPRPVTPVEFDKKDLVLLLLDYELSEPGLT